MDNNWVVWIVFALVLVGAEALAGEFVLLMLGAGAVGGGVAAAFGADWWLSAIVFAVVSIAMLLIVRPPLKRHFEKGPLHVTNSDALLGTRAEVTQAVDADGGQVRLSGEIWSARAAYPGKSFAVGEKVVVHNIDGAIAVVEGEDSWTQS